jgi:flavin reductase (DIM6/NTAB) family NADH-FMN oxidoreductase RutF
VTLDPDSFRSVLGRFASGVTIVTACDTAGVDHGMTVSAFCSVSLTPPVVLICIDRIASMHDVLLGTSHFAVNMLASGQEALSRRFASQETERRFDGVGYTRGQTGAAILDDVLAYVECRVTDHHAAGDHVVFFGEVIAALARSERPLLYYRGGYAQLER